MFASQIKIPNLEFHKQILAGVSLYFANIVDSCDSGFIDLTADQLVLLLDEVSLQEDLILRVALTWLTHDTSRHSDSEYFAKFAYPYSRSDCA